MLDVWLSLDDFEQKQDENDGEDKAKTSATVVTEAGTHAISTKAEHQNQNDQNDEHFTFSAAAKIRRSFCVMQILFGVADAGDICFFRFHGRGRRHQSGLLVDRLGVGSMWTRQ